MQKSIGKVLPLIFWDQDGILLTHYLSRGQTINAEYYSSLLVQMNDILKEKCCGTVSFLHDNAPGHWELATQKKLAYLAEYYSSLLVQMNDILKEKRCGMVSFLHDNAPGHWELATQKKLACMGFQCLDHTPYLPDLAPSD